MTEPESPSSAKPTVDQPHVAGRVEAALRGLRFGTVTLVVQDGVVVQVERTEKIRLTR